MPYVNVQITREGDTSVERKAEVIQGITKVLEEVLGKSPSRIEQHSFCKFGHSVSGF